MECGYCVTHLVGEALAAEHGDVVAAPASDSSATSSWSTFCTRSSFTAM